MNQQIQRLNHTAGSTLRLFGRAVIGTGAWATTSNLAGIRAMVKKVGTAATYEGALTVNSVMYDTLQTTDPAWTDDSNDARTSRGYNFAWTVPASAFPSAGWYTVEVVFTDTSGSVTRIVYEGAVRGTLGCTPAAASSSSSPSG